ncbi:MAG: hypothetical protein R3322_22290, partial [Kiloniellales bacterium]|nr:hypothetical protein [Kiloniellales bacterium]
MTAATTAVTTHTPAEPGLDVVIPALDAAGHIEATLAALAEGRDGGLVRQVLVVVGCSRAVTAARARRAGATVIAG